MVDIGPSCHRHALAVGAEGSLTLTEAAEAWQAVFSRILAFRDTYFVDTPTAVSSAVNDVVIKVLKDGQEVACEDLTIFTLELEVGTKLTTLMKDVSFEVDISPVGLMGEYEIQRQQVGQSEWITVSTENQATLTQRLAGIFNFRAVVTIGGLKFMSEEPHQGLTVQFPSFQDIVNDPLVKTALDSAWVLTKALASPVGVQELGFFILLDTQTGKYEFTETVFGGIIDPHKRVTLNLGPKPPDFIGSESAIYVVADFHTHTPMTYVKGNRVVGPSPDFDGPDAIIQDIPGLVYDYIGTAPHSPAKALLYGGHDLDDPAKIYLAGFARRSTPGTQPA